jgi:hypothetical protein
MQEGPCISMSWRWFSRTEFDLLTQKYRFTYGVLQAQQLQVSLFTPHPTDQQPARESVAIAAVALQEVVLSLLHNH